MLTFFRKHQRLFFGFTAVVVIASFSFFGTSGLVDKTTKGEQDPLGIDINGKVFTKTRVNEMVRFLSSSYFDLTDDKVSSPNWLNDGILEKDFLSSSLGMLLAEKIESQIQEEQKNILQKIHSFRPYRHSSAPFLTAEGVWGQFAPETVYLASELMNTPEAPTLKTFDLLSRFYLSQRSFPAFFLRRILSYQESQTEGIQVDPSLPYADVSLLGLHSVQEALGDKYLQAASQFILNASAYATSKGLKVGVEEIRKELLANVYESAKKSSRDFDSQNLYPVFLQQVRNLGMEEIECLSLWKDIALFRKVINSYSLDPVLLQEICDQAKQRARVEVFSLPSYLQIKDFTSFLKLQLYIQAVSSSKVYRDVLDFPQEFLTVGEIEKTVPELVRRDYELEYAEIDLKQASSQIGLKEMWDWQTKEEGWSLLQQKFTVLAKKKASTQEERFALLEQVDSSDRVEIDRFAREKILICKGIRPLFEKADFHTKSCLLSQKGAGIPFKEIKNKNHFLSLLEKAALWHEINSSEEALKARESLSFYTEDEKVYYSIRVVKRSLDKRILTFQEANTEGLLLDLLDKRLEAIYPEVRKKEARTYLRKEGGFEPISKVRDKVGLMLFPDIMRAIRDEYSAFYGKEVTADEKANPLFYVQYCMLHALKTALALQQEGTTLVMDPLKNQWDLVKEEKLLPQSDREIFINENLFDLSEGSFSPLMMKSMNKTFFFRMISHEEVEKGSEEEEKKLLPLKQEAQKKLFLEILDKIEEKKAMTL